MTRTRTTLLYILPLAAIITIAWLVLGYGKGLEHVLVTSPQYSSSMGFGQVSDVLRHPLAIFILQLILIIAASQVCAFLFRKIGQPSVMGEIIAGILLGPSFMGAAWPGFTASVFPAESLGNLQMLSQVGLILFMFVIGMELDLNMLREKAGAALLICYFSIVIPFALGLLLACKMYTQFAPAGVPFYAFALFTGIALSITAFPVLARIIRERGISGTKLGTVVITAAAAGDVAAWCMLALIVAVVKADSANSSFYTIAAVVVYALVMLFVVRPLLHKLARRNSPSKVIKRSVMAVIFVTLLLSAYCCEVIGIHALFGAFLAGAIMPHEWNFRKLLIDKIEDVALVLLLPLFFVFTGLRTQVGLLNDASLWGSCLWIVLAAVAGKFGGSFIAARLMKETMRDSVAIGALMNTRGLVELVVLNIGYDLHILSPQMFTMMVLMALITTFMTNPLLNLVNRFA